MTTTMTVKMKTLSAGPNGVREIGKTYEVDAEEGQALCSGGFAVPVGVVPQETRATATVAPAETRGDDSWAGTDEAAEQSDADSDQAEDAAEKPEDEKPGKKPGKKR